MYLMLIMFPTLELLLILFSTQAVTCRNAATREVWSDIRLVKGANRFQGRVEVKVNGKWGTVCDDMWSKPDGNVVCKQLGFNRAVAVFPGGTFGKGRGPIMFTNLQCNNSEHEMNISDCPGVTEPTQINCTHARDAGVRCQRPFRRKVEPVCNTNQFLCKKSKMCIPTRWVCDGTNDCYDHSDESYMICGGSNHCGTMQQLARQTPRIVGGRTVKKGAWPWLASIKIIFKGLSSEHLCGGALISSQWVVTAAHCFDSYINSINNFEVIFGEYTMNVTERTEQTFAISSILLHENYTRGSHVFDIALLKLARPVITPTPYVNDICLPGYRDPPFSPDERCFVVGWGATSDTKFSNTLQQLMVPIINTTVCDEWYEHRLGTGMLCAGYEFGGKDACKGDSGGPLSCLRNGKWYLAGIVSWGDGCAMVHHPGVYSDILHYLPWIAKSVSSTPIIQGASSILVG